MGGSQMDLDLTWNKPFQLSLSFLICVTEPEWD